MQENRGKCVKMHLMVRKEVKFSLRATRRHCGERIYFLLTKGSRHFLLLLPELPVCRCSSSEPMWVDSGLFFSGKRCAASRPQPGNSWFILNRLFCWDIIGLVWVWNHYLSITKADEGSEDSLPGFRAAEVSFLLFNNSSDLALHHRGWWQQSVSAGLKKSSSRCGICQLTHMGTSQRIRAVSAQ